MKEGRRKIQYKGVITKKLRKLELDLTGDL